MIRILLPDAGKPIFIGPGNLGPVKLESLMHAFTTSKVLEYRYFKRVKTRARPLSKNQSCPSSPSSEQTAVQYDVLSVLIHPTQNIKHYFSSSGVCAFSSQASIQGLAFCFLMHVELLIMTTLLV